MVPGDHPDKEGWSTADNTGIGARGIRESHINLGYYVRTHKPCKNRDPRRINQIERIKRVEAQYATRLPKVSKRVSWFAHTGESAKARGMRWNTYCIPIPKYHMHGAFPTKYIIKDLYRMMATP